MAGSHRRPSAHTKLNGTRYVVALVVLLVLTASSFLITRGFVREEHVGDDMLAAIAEMRTELGTLQLTTRDLVATLRAEPDDDVRIRGQRRALRAAGDRLRQQYGRLRATMALVDVDPAAWALLDGPPYRLDAVLADMEGDVEASVADTRSHRLAEDLLPYPTPHDDGFLAVTDGHATAARLGADRLAAHLRALVDQRRAAQDRVHAWLGWGTLVVLIGEALVLFWPLLGNLGREVRRADQATSELARLARHDVLTGLLNRASLIWEIGAAIAASDPATQRLAVLLIDLDRFKPINDMFGHAAGDGVLVEIARRLQLTLRPGDVVARLGGDEFVVMLPRTGSDDDVREIGLRLNRAIVREMEIEGHRLRLGASIGCAFWPEDAIDVDGLLSSADLAMYQAKRNDHDEPVFFDEELRSDVARVRSEEADLRQAIAGNQLALLYQPIVSRDGRVLHGFEALLRWNHPELGLLSPDRFLPTAERCGLMSQITAWVLDRACRQHAAWTAGGLDPGLMSINVPEAFLTQPDAVEQVLTIARLHGVPCDRLALEISERVMTGDDHAPISQQLEAAHASGLRIALDEFGLGQASLIHLRKPGIDILKIDHAFVRDLAHAPENVAIVGAMIELARILDKQIVIEGVETAEQAALLAISERAWVQGFLYARPLSTDGATAFIIGRRKAAAPQRLAATQH